MAKRIQARNKRKQLREIAQIDAMERRLERSSMPAIRKELNIIANEALRAYRTSGQTNANLTIEAGARRIQETLEGVYKRTIKQTEKVLKQNYPKDSKKVEQVKRELERNFKKQAEKSAKQISASTQRQFEKVIQKGFEDELSRDEIEKKLKKKMTKNAYRAKVISETEIGSVAAEGRDKLSKKVFDKESLKEWVTYRDSKVRDPHQHAEGQTVGISENFVIRGKRTERPPYPRWRGLSAGQKINCRCKAIFLKVE